MQISTIQNFISYMLLCNIYVHVSGGHGGEAHGDGVLLALHVNSLLERRKSSLQY